MIRVYHTIIDETLIRGVSQLYGKRPPYPNAFNERSYYFTVYCTAYYFVISTDVLQGVGPDKDALKAEFAHIKADHKKLQDAIITNVFSSLVVSPTQEMPH